MHCKSSKCNSTTVFRRVEDLEVEAIRLQNTIKHRQAHLCSFHTVEWLTHTGWDASAGGAADVEGEGRKPACMLLPPLQWKRISGWLQQVQVPDMKTGVYTLPGPTVGAGSNNSCGVRGDDISYCWKHTQANLWWPSAMLCTSCTHCLFLFFQKGTALPFCSYFLFNLHTNAMDFPFSKSQKRSLQNAAQVCAVLRFLRSLRPSRLKITASLAVCLGSSIQFSVISESTGEHRWILTSLRSCYVSKSLAMSRDSRNPPNALSFANWPRRTWRLAFPQKLCLRSYRVLEIWDFSATSV